MSLAIFVIWQGHYIYDLIEKALFVSFAPADLAENPTVLNKKNAGSIAGCKSIVGHHQNGRSAFLIHAHKAVQQHPGSLGIQGAGRLV